MGVKRPAFVAALFAVVASLPAHATPPPGAPNCPTFPANSVWHSDVSKMPVHPRNAAWKTSMSAATARLHPDFGPSFGEPRPYGIPYDVVAGTHARVSVAFDYDDESDDVGYPIGDDTTIEMGSDRHALIIDRDACILFELYALRRANGGWAAGSGARFDLRSNALRPQGWTSADAAGLSIFAGLLRRDEVAAGRVDHAIRFTADRTSRAFLWPARHQAGATDDPNVPPMGARFRLRSSFDISGFRTDTQVVLRAMKRYGMILADNGSDWYFTGTSEDGWNTDLLDELKSIPAGAFDAVNVSSLRMDPDSARARQPVTVTMSVRDATLNPGEVAALSGHVTPMHAGKHVTLQRRTCSTCAWTNVATKALDVNSSFRFWTRSDVARALGLRAIYLAQDPDHLGGASPLVRVTWRWTS